MYVTAGGQQDLFTQLDTDGDGVLSREEPTIIRPLGAASARGTKDPEWHTSQGASLGLGKARPTRKSGPA